MLTLLIKSSLIILILLAFYKLILEKESFFKANRIYLIGCLIIAGLLPFISIPQLVQHQGIVSSWIDDPAPRIENSTTESDLSELSGANQEILTVESSASDAEITPATLQAESAEINPNPVTLTNTKDLSYWIMMIYLFGVVVLTINLIAQVIGMVWKVVKSTDRIEDDDCVIINTSTATEPCSFFKYIFINPELYDYETYEQIVEHEKIHVRQHHTLDLLLSEIAVILMWFNPFIWLFRKEVEKNIEYQTDDLLVNDRQEIKEGYQMNLVNIATYTKPLAITTNYNQSLIKQRILKMNSKKSNNYNYWKYAFAMPILFATILILNEPQTAYAQNDSGMAMNEKEAQRIDNNSDLEVPTIENKNQSLTVTTLSTNDQSDQEQLSQAASGEANDEDSSQLNVKAEMDLTQLSSQSGVDSRNIINKDCRKLLEAIRNDDIQLVSTLIKSTDPNCVDPNPGYDDIKINGNRWRMEKAGVPLLAVARTGNLDIAKLLVGAGAQVNYEDHSEGTAIITAADYGHLDLLKYFVANGGNIDVKSANHGSALIAAAGRGHLDVVKYLVENGEEVDYYSPNQGNALIAAAQSGSLETIKYIISKGADIKFLAPNQGTALIAACRRSDLGLVKYLIEQGADLHRIAPNQGTALIAAASHGQMDMVEYLIDLGSDVNQYSPNQGTALIVSANNGYLETVEYLISEGANVDYISPNQGSALSVAAHNGHTDIVNLLSGKVKNINAMSDGHGNALISAARNGHMALVNSLLEKGAEINQHNDGQGFALNAAATNGINEMVEFLLENGAQINLQNDGQGSALNAAARNGHMSTVKLLVHRGANVNLYSDGQGTALSAASKNRHQTIVDYLESEGAKHIYGRE